MIFTKPDYYDTFKCKANLCTDNCCIGWEIDIDENTYEKYKNIKNDFGKEFSSAINSNEETPFFKLDKTERCAMLDSDNLCRIIKNLGEDYLCDICRLHPRFVFEESNLKETGIGICCERMCEILIEKNDETQILTENKNSEAITDNFLNLLFNMREIIFSMLKDKSISLSKRFEKIISSVKKAQFFIDNGDGESALNAFREENNYVFPDSIKFIKLMSSLEIMDTKWTEILKKLEKNYNKIISAESEFDNKFNENEIIYENTAVYFIYRYFLTAFFDGDIFSLTFFSFLSVKIIKLCDILSWLENKDGFTDKNKINNMKLYSKEIEYCTENIEKIRDFIWEE